MVIKVYISDAVPDDCCINEFAVYGCRFALFVFSLLPYIMLIAASIFLLSRLIVCFLYLFVSEFIPCLVSLCLGGVICI